MNQKSSLAQTPKSVRWVLTSHNHQNFGAKMTLRRHLKLTNCSTIAERHPRSRTFRTTQAVNAYTSEDKNDAMLLTGNDG